MGGLAEKRIAFILTQFVLFEITVGMYFPACGTLKGKIVPESCRATLYNIFRIPLNVVVVLALLFKAEPADTLLLTTTLLCVSALLSIGLRKYVLVGLKGGREYNPVVSEDVVGAV